MSSPGGAAVAARLAARGIEVTMEQAGKLDAYIGLLERWNRVHNLISVRDSAILVDRHLTESLALAPFVRGPRAADVGSGGGLPGVPLAICLAEIEFTLIEPRRKRASFLRHVAATLGLTNITVEQARAEELDDEPYATVLARAVAPPRELLALTRNLVAPGGRLVLLTGEDKAREIVAVAQGFTELPVELPVAGLVSRIVVLELKTIP